MRVNPVSFYCRIDIVADHIVMFAFWLRDNVKIFATFLTLNFYCWLILLTIYVVPPFQSKTELKLNTSALVEDRFF